MKMVYAGIFLGSALVLGISSLWTLQKRTRISAAIRAVMLISILPTLAMAVVTATTSETLCRIAYTVYTASITWLMVLLLRFCLVYARFPYKQKGLPRAIIAAAVLDNVLMLATLPVGGIFVLESQQSAASEVFFRQTFRAAGYPHVVLCYALMALCVAALVVRMRRIPSMYWGKYLTALVFILFALCGNLSFVLRTTDVNLAVISIAPACALLVYFALFYKPRLIIDRMLKRVVNKSNDLVCFFDVDRECIYANDRALSFFGLDDDRLYMAGMLLTDWLEGTDFSWSVGRDNYVCTRVWKGRTTHLEFCFDHVHQRGKEVGAFFHIHDITDAVSTYETQRYAATHDSLTGLYNRDYLFQCIHHTLMEHPETDYYLFVSDIKEFKLINDIFGRPVGDEVLVRSAAIIREQLGNSAVYGRIGNDRFCLLLTKPQLDTLAFTENQQRLSRFSRDIYYPILVHGGVYAIMNRAMPVASMVDHAVMALSSIKHSHEIRIAYYDEEIRQQLLWEHKVVAEIEDAIRERQFEIYLQPQADAQGVVRGAEVLIRWNHPEEGLLSPAAFVQVFEKNGLITKMDLFVWEEACRLLQKWKQTGHEDFYLSVNISPNDFYYVDVHQTFTALAAKYGIQPRNLKLEITETVMIADIDRKVALIDQLHESGFSVEMDDFGSGYSSLNMLKDIPVDVLKIDMAFLYQAKDKKRSQIIIEQVVVLSKELGIPVITEGVETEEQVAFLRGIGCDMFQGYYFAKPLPVPAFEERYFGTDGERQYAEAAHCIETGARSC